MPSRDLGDRLVVARPADGAPVVLAPTAAALWDRLTDWSSEADLDNLLAGLYPTVSAEERTEARAGVLAALDDDSLIDRR